MIDMHSHCLPGVDDGAKTIEDGLNMLSFAKNHGVTLVAATPHCITDREEGVSDFIEKRNNAYKELKEAILQSGEEYPDVICGAEVYLGCDVSEFSNLHELCYQNTNYLLLEMPTNYEASILAEWIYNISTKGIIPVIAHIDRYIRYKLFLEEFDSVNDIIFQFNASVFQTIAGRRLVKNAFKLRSNFIVSSDMHNCTTRPCKLPGAFEIAKKKFPEKCDMLFHKGAECILNNKAFLV